MSDALIHTVVLMGTVVSVHVVGHGASQGARRERQRGVDRALAWFRRVEAVCSRFDATSELRQLSTHIGTPVPVSPMLFQAVQFAVAVAADTNGAFDPTVGVRMESRGFNRDYRTGADVRSDVSVTGAVSYRDVEVDAAAQTITLHQPLLLDLGAVAKGLAVDMAALELMPFANFAIDAGGDLYLGGRNADDAMWSVGIRHPRDATQLLDTLHVTDTAVCTSGDYERVAPTMAVFRDSAGDADVAKVSHDHHIINPATGSATQHVASATVIALSAMVADALATAAFVLGPVDGIALLERHNVHGVLVTPALERFATS